MTKTLGIAFFGVVGVLARYWINEAVQKFPTISSTGFPFGTFFINWLGAFLIGVIYAWTLQAPSALTPELRTGLMVGFLGGFTTFSSFCLETAQLIEKSRLIYAALYMVGSPILGLLSTFVGIFLVKKFLAIA